MNLPLPLSPLEEGMLLAVYRQQFDRGDDAERADGLDWREWAREAGFAEEDAGTAVDELAERHLVEDDEPTGARIRLRLTGVLRSEKSPLVDLAFAARQKSIRRRILAALLRARDTLGPFAGRTVEQIAVEIREPAGDVLANYRVLRDMGFVTGASGGRLIRIAEGGVKALGNGLGGDRAGDGETEGGYEGWPLG